MSDFTILAQRRERRHCTQENPFENRKGRVRWVMLAMLLAISMVTYLDRVNISVAAKFIMPAYHLNNVQMGKIFSAFVFGYALFQIPAGWLGDRFGPRRLLTFAMIWWSVATAATALAGELFPVSIMSAAGSFLLVRFLIGAGEAAAYPNFNRVIAFWMAPGERGLSNSLVLGASGMGAAIAPPFIGWIMSVYGWKESFYVCGVIGILLALVWHRFSTDRPEEHPWVGASEMAVIRGEPSQASRDRIGGKRTFGELVRSRNIWMLIVSNFLFGYVAYIYLTWFYLYLVDVRHFSILKSSFYATLPFIAITLMTPIGGALSDRLCRTRGKCWGRRSVAMAGMILAALCVALGGRVEHPYLAIFLLSLGAGFLYFSIGVYWATVIDIARDNVGLVSGMMNCGGNTGGTLSPTLTPMLAAAFGWSMALNVAALAAFLGGLLWMFIDADQPVEGRAGWCAESGALPVR